MTPMDNLRLMGAAILASLYAFIMLLIILSIVAGIVMVLYIGASVVFA